MTLEDFFTLTEMKDGVTTVARIEELVNVMHKEKDHVVKNIGEAARHWSTVASTLAATENKECLGLFIQLDGLWFFDRWIQEAQKCGHDTSDNFVEESITGLLGALEKLPIDQERSISSGIEVTIKTLFSHKSSRVQDRAKALFDSWNQGRGKEADNQDFYNGGPCLDDEVSTSVEVAVKSGCTEQSGVDVFRTKQNANSGYHEVDPAEGKILESRSSDVSQQERVKDLKIPKSNCTTLSQADKEDAFPGGPDSSVVLNPGQKSLSNVDESFIRLAEGDSSIGTCSSPVPVKGNVEGKSLDVPEPRDFTNDVKETAMSKSFPGRLDTMEMSSVPTTTLGSECVSSIADPVNAQESVTEHAVLTDFAAEQSDSCLKKASALDFECDVRTPASNPNSGVFDCGMLNLSKSIIHFGATNQDGQRYPNVLHDVSSNSCISRKTDDPESSSSRMESIGAFNNVNKLSSESISEAGGGDDSVFSADISKLEMDRKNSDKFDKRGLDMELEYGVDDALEVARKVAKEVEREVGAYGENFCSSSEKNSGGGIGQPGSPDSVNVEQDQPATRLIKYVPTRHILSSVASPSKEENLMSSKNMDTEPEDYMRELESSRVSEAAQEPESNTGKGMCVFDLNEEVHSEELNPSTVPVSTHISVVTASRAAAAPGLPVSPLQFEGALGWKGSAATSAFRRASPRRIPDGDKVHSTEGSSYSSKQRQDLLQIDLNVLGCDDNIVCDPILANQIQVSCGLLSGESSIEISSRRAVQLNLDLNCIGDDDDVPSSDLKMKGHSFHHHLQNGHCSPSPASSSSSVPPSMKNFDLNDRPSFVDESYEQHPDLGRSSSSQEMNAFGLRKPDDPAIPLMGTRLEFNRKDFVPQTRSFLPTRLPEESPVCANWARVRGGVAGRPLMSYTRPPLFDYNGPTVGPSAVYEPGSIPYMVDSRGSPVVPQLMGPVATLQPSYSQPLLLMSMPGPTSGISGLGLIGRGLDLNSGLMLDGGRRESGGLRQLFLPGQGVVLEDNNMRSGGPQPLMSGIGAGKRKEPDGGWGSYPLNYKQQPPWQ